MKSNLRKDNRGSNSEIKIRKKDNVRDSIFRNRSSYQNDRKKKYELRNFMRQSDKGKLHYLYTEIVSNVKERIYTL